MNFEDYLFALGISMVSSMSTLLIIDKLYKLGIIL